MFYTCKNINFDEYLNTKFTIIRKYLGMCAFAKKSLLVTPKRVHISIFKLSLVLLISFNNAFKIELVPKILHFLNNTIDW